MYLFLSIWLFLLTQLVTPAVALAFDDNAPPVWPALEQSHFGDKVIQAPPDLLLLEAPRRAEHTAIVPVTIQSLFPRTNSRHITKLHLFIDKNPMPHAAGFELGPSLTDN